MVAQLMNFQSFGWYIWLWQNGNLSLFCFEQWILFRLDNSEIIDCPKFEKTVYLVGGGNFFWLIGVTTLPMVEIDRNGRLVIKHSMRKKIGWKNDVISFSKNWSRKMKSIIIEL